MVRPSSTGRSGLTRIDVTVVFSVVAVLICLLLPACQNVRQAAAIAQSQNNLKSLALAVNNFIAKTNGKVPPSYGEYGTTKGSLFFHLLPNLEGGTAAAAGPATDTTAAPLKVLEAPLDVSNPGGTGLTSYASNGSLFGGSGEDPTKTPMTTTNILPYFISKGNTNLLMFAERYASLNSVWSGPSCYFFGAVKGSQIQFNVTPASATGGASPGYVQAFDQGGCNVCFGDGSVRAINNKGANPTTNFVWACTPTTTTLPTTDW